MSNNKGIKKLDKKGRRATSFTYDAEQYDKVLDFCEAHHTTFTLLMRKLLDDFRKSKGF
jgi:hypothetical protein